MTLTSLDGAKVLVTGASSGIGAALAPALAERGATVGIVARRAERLDAVRAACIAASPGGDPGHRSWAVDLSDLDAAARVALEAWDAFGQLDVLVNNAAQPMRRHVTKVDLDTLGDVMRTNFESPVAMGMAVLPRMLERDRGVIVNVSSLGGRLGILNESAYCASKFALCGWSEAMAMDLWSTGVDVRLVIPGPIDTEIWDQPGNDPAAFTGPFEPPETVATAICDAIVGDAFECYVPDLKAVAEFKTGDIDGFMAGVVGFDGG
ncbi:MAG: SDR family NAD(P)-dependent oxidoreductase [Acidimicrobiia bacterium]|nr:SDR family NAD(P)-dependent oxidoreductase [Acidimicrobiia bacterium]